MCVCGSIINVKEQSFLCAHGMNMTKIEFCYINLEIFVMKITTNKNNILELEWT